MKLILEVVASKLTMATESAEGLKEVADEASEETKDKEEEAALVGNEQESSKVENDSGKEFAEPMDTSDSEFNTGKLYYIAMKQFCCSNNFQIVWLISRFEPTWVCLTFASPNLLLHKTYLFLVIIINTVIHLFTFSHFVNKQHNK